MFEILEDLWVLPSQINPEKDNSKATNFKVNLSSKLIFKNSNPFLNTNDNYLQSLSGFSNVISDYYTYPIIKYITFKKPYLVITRCTATCINLKSFITQHNSSLDIIYYFISFLNIIIPLFCKKRS